MLHAAVTIEIIDFNEVKPAGSSLEFTYGCIGADPFGVIYAGFGGSYNGAEDVQVFAYDSKTGKKTPLGSLRGQAAAQDNLLQGEPITKGHTPIAYMNGKMYLGTQAFHDLQGSPQPNTYRGSHIFSIDCETFELFDHAASQPEGVFQRGQGILCMTTLPEKNLVVAEALPTADIILYNPDTDETEIIHPPSDLNGQHTGRGVLAGADGKIYWSRGWGTTPVYMYDTETGGNVTQVYTTSNGFWNGHAKSADHKDLYVSTYGNVYHLNTDEDKWDKIGSFGSGECWVWGIALSLDEKKIYTIPNRCGGLTMQLVEMDIETGETVNLAQANVNEFVSGTGATDPDGCVYFVQAQGRLVKCDVTERTGPGPVAVGTPLRHAVPRASDAVSVRVFDLSGRAVARAAAGAGDIMTTVRRAGIYIVEHCDSRGNRLTARPSVRAF
jgi:hypothetical protein